MSAKVITKRWYCCSFSGRTSHEWVACAPATPRHGPLLICGFTACGAGPHGVPKGKFGSSHTVSCRLMSEPQSFTHCDSVALHQVYPWHRAAKGCTSHRLNRLAPSVSSGQVPVSDEQRLKFPQRFASNLTPGLGTAGGEQPGAVVPAGRDYRTFGQLRKLVIWGLQPRRSYRASYISPWSYLLRHPTPDLHTH